MTTQCKHAKSIGFFVFAVTGVMSGLSADITGTVYQDLPVHLQQNGSVSLSTYGQQESNEPGLYGISVTGVDKAGSTVTVRTDAKGHYTLKGLRGTVRVTFQYPSYLNESPVSASQNGAVRFVSANAQDVDLALHDPSDYVSSAHPKLMTTIYTSGDPNDPGNANLPRTETLASIPYSTTNKWTDNSVYSSKLGSVWGLAYNRAQSTLYIAASLRRHAGLKADLGTIFSYDLNSKADPGVFMTLTNVGTINNRDLGKATDPSHDPDAFAKIGRVGLGDIDVSLDGKYLFATNLHTRKIVQIDIAQKQVMRTYAFPQVCDASTGTFHPYALTYHHGALYAGGVCDASLSGNASDLSAHVFKIDTQKHTVDEVLSFDLDYNKQYADDGSCANNTGWYAWSDQFNIQKCKTYKENGILMNVVVHPEPILSDIEFDEHDNMILGFTDRSTFQYGTYNYGIDPNDNNTFYLSKSGGDILFAPYDAQKQKYTDVVINKTGGEYFTGDNKGSTHKETALGGLALLPGSDSVVTTIMDPADWRQGGLRWFSKSNGKTIKSVVAYSNIDDKHRDIANTRIHYGKGGGMGDVELLTDPAPIEIGNRVWLDTNGNGIQDPEESGIAGVTVQLFDENGQKIATAQTDKNGEYIFSNATGKSTQSFRYNLTALQPNTGYRVVIPDIAGGKHQKALNDYLPTQADAGGDDQIDSDGIVKGSIMYADVEQGDLPYAGANNHSFDFGFVPMMSLGSVVWFDANDNGIQDKGEKSIDGLKVTLLDGNAQAFDGTVSMLTHDGGHYLFEHLKPGTYTVKIESGSTKLTNYAVNFSVQASDADNDTANDSNIASGNVTTALLSAPITLTPGNEPVGSDETSALGSNGDNQDDTADANGNMTLDFGLKPKPKPVKTPKPQPVKTQPTMPAPKPQPAKPTPKPQPVKPAPKPQPAKPQQVKPTPAPQPVQTAPKPKPPVKVPSKPQTTTTAPEFYHIGTHFWIDGSNGGALDKEYQMGIETPVPNAHVELLNSKGERLYWTDDTFTTLTTRPTEFQADTYTDDNGRYDFYVPAGEYKVHFTIPENLAGLDYAFTQRESNDDNDRNINDADPESGLTETVVVGPDQRVEDLTLDAAVHCPCSDIQGDAIDALSTRGLLIMMLLTLTAGMMLVSRRQHA